MKRHYLHMFGFLGSLFVESEHSRIYFETNDCPYNNLVETLMIDRGFHNVYVGIGNDRSF